LSLRKEDVAYEGDTEEEGESWKEDHGGFKIESERAL